MTILDAHANSASNALVDLSFNSLQAAANGPNHETCDNWTLAYTLVQAADGSWLIDSTAPYNGTTHTAC